MAAVEEGLDDGFELLLPSQFLTDEDILLDFAGEDDGGGKFGGNGDGFGGLRLNLRGFNSSSKFAESFGRSDLSSPVDSGSGIWGTEMESTSCASEEDIFNPAGLSRRFARSSIDDHIPNSKGWVFSRSPQSTLSGGEFGGSCDCRLTISPSSGSPSPVWSATPLSPAMAGKGRDGAAGEVAVMRSRREEGTGFFSPRIYKSSSSSFPFHKEKKRSNQGVWGQSMVDRKIDVSRSQPSSPSSRMRAAVLDSPGSKKQCSGTGVFLPKPMDSRNKTCCSTVLIPAKVVQALSNLQNAQSNPPSPSLDFDVVMRTGGKNGIEEGSPRALGASSVEKQLPQEWTY